MYSTKKKLNITLADDDEDDRYFFELAFSEARMDIKLKMVQDGQELMQALQSTPELPDIVFLDLNMPRKNGMECLREIRGSSILKELIVIIYSTSNNPSDVEDAFIAGANTYIIKPSDFQQLKKILSNVVSLSWQYLLMGMDKEHFILKI